MSKKSAGGKGARKSAGGRCPIHTALDTVGDRWSLLVIRDLVFKGKSHYREFLESPEKISTNILANRLEKLDNAGVITKSIDPENASRFIYALTEKGRDLIPVLLELTAWSAKHEPQPGGTTDIIRGAPKHLLRRLRSDRDALIAEILENLDTP